MVSNAWVTRRFWAEDVSTTYYLINRGPHTSIYCKTPYEVWSNKHGDHSLLRVFGSTVYYHVNEGKSELDLRWVYLWVLRVELRAIESSHL